MHKRYIEIVKFKSSPSKFRLRTMSLSLQKGIALTILLDFLKRII